MQAGISSITFQDGSTFIPFRFGGKVLNYRYSRILSKKMEEIFGSDDEAECVFFKEMTVKGRVLDCEEGDNTTTDIKDDDVRNVWFRSTVDVVRDVNDGRMKGSDWTDFIPICSGGSWGVLLVYICKDEDGLGFVKWGDSLNRTPPNGLMDTVAGV